MIGNVKISHVGGGASAASSVTKPDERSVMTPDAAAHAETMETANSGSEYIEYLRALQAKWNDCPSVELVFKDLSYCVRNGSTIADARSQAAREARARTGHSIPSKAEENIPDLAKATMTLGLLPYTIVRQAYDHLTGAVIDPAETLVALAPVSGVIRPGTMTLVLAPPGGGA